MFQQVIVLQNLICILGHTAAGKTALAAHLCNRINGEIISADSRQVYKGMDIGTGKDIEDYTIHNTTIPVHLLDIKTPGEKYNIFEFSHDFHSAVHLIAAKGKMPVCCGGSGLYIETVLKNYKMIEVPVNQELRNSLTGKSLDELASILSKYRKLHNHSDTDTVKRAVRAIEIADFEQKNKCNFEQNQEYNALVFGIAYNRETRRERITFRLKERLNNGLVEEAELLLKNGLSHADMEYYGLEYKYLSFYLAGKLSFNEMFEQLNTAIHQFAKRQMTWFRRMERNGTNIIWIDSLLPFELKIDFMLQKTKSAFE